MLQHQEKTKVDASALRAQKTSFLVELVITAVESVAASWSEFLSGSSDKSPVQLQVHFDGHFPNSRNICTHWGRKMWLGRKGGTLENYQTLQPFCSLKKTFEAIFSKVLEN